MKYSIYRYVGIVIHYAKSTKLNMSSSSSLETTIDLRPLASPSNSEECYEIEYNDFIKIAQYLWFAK